MKKINGKDISKVFDEGTPIDEAGKKAVREALRRHKRLGNSIAVWRDGKVLWIPSEKIPVDE